MSVTTIPQICGQCKIEFQAQVREIKRGNAKFCSRACSGKFKTENKQVRPPNSTCAWCYIDFYRPTYRQESKSGLVFCSRIHKDEAQRIGGLSAIMPSHYGNALMDYRKVAFRSLPNECRVCGYNKHLNVLEVNHIDCDRSNNSINNLEILCPTHHVEFHFETKTGKWASKVAHSGIEPDTEIL